MQYNFIAIGDIVTDAFIKLKDASVHCDINKENCEICMRFGDKIPYEEVYVVPAVGNSANAAVSAARLGLKSALISNIGKDFFGQECLDALTAEGVGTEYVTAHENLKTNYHYVLWYEDDRTILVKHEKFDHILPNIIKDPEWIYLSSIGDDSEPFYKFLEDYLSSRPAVKLVFQPGTYQMKMGVEKLKGIYARSEVFVCNKEEAGRILDQKTDEIKELLQGIRELGPKIIVITDGPKGAYASYENKMFFMPPYPDPKPPYERTGAGDAFSSTFAGALALGLTIEEALRWAPINSMSVVQQVGARAGLLKREQLEEFFKNAPADYLPVTLN